MMTNNRTPRFPFGYGLSYTTFNYSSLSVSATSSGGAKITFVVKNTGAIAGTEIPQVYLGYPASAGEPPMVLRGFDEVDLAVGQSSTVEIDLSQRDMSIWDVVGQKWSKPSGTFTIYVGASIADIRLKGTL
jgi:beta-glucosidase